MPATKKRPRGATFKRMIRKANRKRKASGFEKEIHSLLREEGIAFTPEKTIGRCHADILIDGTKVILECQGCFWHGHSCQGDLNKMQETARAKDARRFYFFRKLGFEVIEIWECDYTKDPEKTRTLLRSIKARKAA